MENKKERVLAYNRAKIIEKEDLADVSGGGWHWTHFGTGGASGGSGQGGEVHIDVTIDW